jgi:hypothetical protein
LQYALIAVSSAKTRLSPSFIMKLPSSISKQAWAVASVSVENERLLYFKGVRLTKPVNEVVPHPEHLIPALSPNRPARVRRRWLSREFPLEKVCLLLAVETDLEPDAISGVRDRQERDWLDVAVVQPSTDSIHSLAEGTSGSPGLVSICTTNGGSSAISRSFLSPVRRERLSVGAVSLTGHTNEAMVAHISSVAFRLFL